MSKCNYDVKSTDLTDPKQVRANRGKMGELFYVTRSLVDAEEWITQLMDKTVYNYQKRNGGRALAPESDKLIFPPVKVVRNGVEHLVVGDRILTDPTTGNRFEVNTSYQPMLPKPYLLEFVVPSYLFNKEHRRFVTDKTQIEYFTVKFSFQNQPEQADIKRAIVDYLGYFPYNADESYEEFCGLIRAEFHKPIFNWVGKSGNFVSNITGSRHHNITFLIARRKFRTDEVYAECLLRTLMVPSTTIIVK